MVNGLRMALETLGSITHLDGRRLLSHREAARYLGMAPGEFDEAQRADHAPRPVYNIYRRVPGRKRAEADPRWDLRELDEWVDRLRVQRDEAQRKVDELLRGPPSEPNRDA